MTLLRLVPVLVLTAAGLAAPAEAGSHRGGVGRPPSAAPGDCFTRRVTGPGGAYRWERIECEAADAGWSGYDQWGYGRDRLDVQTRGGGGDRYGERRRETRYDQRIEEFRYEQERVRRYGGGYDQGRGGPVVNAPPPYADEYVTAGRDEYGYLVWPGKRP